MDFFEINKFAGAVLAAVFMVFGLSFFSDFVFAPEKPAKAGFVIEVTESAGEAASEEPAEDAAEESVLAMIGDIDPEAGLRPAKKCAACHSFEDGGPNKVGPNLWNIVNRKPASVDGFNYSNALKDYGETTNWTYEALDAYLINPKEAIPGNKMSFAGLKKAKDRAAVLSYLRSLSDQPAELPSTGDTAAAETAPAASSGETQAAPADQPADQPAQTEGESSAQ